MNEKSRSDSYAAAGVDITAGYKAVELMKTHIARTVLQGGSEDADSVNDASLCTLFTAGDFRFLDTGDAEAAWTTKRSWTVM